MKRAIEWILVLVLIGSVAGCSDQKKSSASDGAARIRVGCLFYPQANVSIDGKATIDGMVYPFISDYLPVSAGSHTVEVVPADGKGDSASIKQKFADGHSYLVVSYGNMLQNSNHTLKVIDETETLTKINKDQNIVLILNLVTGAPAFDGYVNGEKVLENLAYGQEAVYPMPVGEFDTKMTMAGNPDLVLYQDTSIGQPNSYTVVSLTGTLLSPVLSYDLQSPLPLGDYFTQVAQADGYLDTALAMLQASGLKDQLNGPGPYTLFVSWDSSYIDVSSDEIMADAAKLKDVVQYNIVPQYIPPYVLYHQSELTASDGKTITVTANAAKPHFLFNGSVEVYQDYRASNGIFYEMDGALLPPAQ